jgi:hypothetical protein
VGIKEFAHLAVATFSAVVPTIFLATAMFAFVFQINSLITEKELKLHQVLTFHNLKLKIGLALPSLRRIVPFFIFSFYPHS